jgi:hypothetical protein
MKHHPITSLSAFLSAMTLTSVLAPGARAFVNPSSVQVKVLEVRLSTSADCSNSVSVGVNASPSYSEMTSAPTLLSGAINPATYKCMMLNMSSLIKYTPATTEGVCAAGTVYTRDVCRQSTFATPSGGTGNCTGTAPDDGVESFPWMYFSTTGTGDGQTPATALPLANALVVTGTQNATLVVDFDGKIDGLTQGALCNCEPPAISFR